MSSSLSKSTVDEHNVNEHNRVTEHESYQRTNGTNATAAASNGHAYEPVEYSEDGKRVSEADYWAHYYQHPYRSYEWNNGILEERGMADREQLSLHDWFFTLLGEFLNAYPIAYFIYLDTGMRLSLSQTTTIRKPDLFVICNSPHERHVTEQMVFSHTPTSYCRNSS